MKKLYIVLLNFNGTNDTIECLDSLIKSEYEDIQIIVVDNSQDDTSMKSLINWAIDLENEISIQPKIKEDKFHKNLISYINLKEEDFHKKYYFETILFVKAKSNNGFSSGNNIALKYIKINGDSNSLIWLLNNDTKVVKNTVNQIFEEINKLNNKYNSKIDIIGTPLMEYYDPNIIQALGGRFNEKTGLTSHVGEGLKLSSVSSEYIEEMIKNVTYPIGASIIISKDFLNEIGFLCEDYFLFYEELDWIYRAKQRGGKLFIIYVFSILHKQGNTTKVKSSQKKSEFIDLISLNSRLLFVKKFNERNLKKICFKILVFTIGKRIIQFQFKRIPKIVNLVFKYLV
jgi:GT2 family glycosyltransferase